MRINTYFVSLCWCALFASNLAAKETRTGESKTAESITTQSGIPPRLVGGPDDGGYSYQDQADGCTFDYITLTSPTLVVSGDDAQALLTLGGTGFTLYGTSGLAANTNGFLSTDVGGPGSDWSNDCPIPGIPSTGAGDRLYVSHDDLITDVYHQYFASCPRTNDSGLAPTGCDVVQWQGVYFGSTDNVTVQAIIYDGVPEIVYQYLTDDRGGSGATIGLQDAAVSTGLLYSCNTPSITPGQSAVCIFGGTPIPPCSGDNVIIDNTLFPAGTNYTCNTASTITTGTDGVTIQRNAVVQFGAPSIRIDSPFRVDKGGTFQASNELLTGCLDAGDNDSDRLLNCVETNTGVFVSEDDTGTDPDNPDTDGDAIWDGDEVLGTLAGLDLPALGTSPVRKNILLEYDWFDDNLDPGTCAAHSHRPTPAAIGLVESAFSAAPVNNPDGTTGITLIQDYGQGGAFTGGNLIADPDGVLGGGFDTEFYAHKSANFASNRDGYFHYVVNPHRYNTSSGSSGLAELPGDDLIVSLYCFGSDGNVANTIMHELGHNVLLRHGGFENTNWKPNYNSVMNYKYQFPGTDSCADADPFGDGMLDYSVGDRVVLDENNLDENLGTCGTLAWDWNGNTVIETGVVADINCEFDGTTCDGVLTSLQDSNDWANFIFTGLSDADGAPLSRIPQEIVECDNPVPNR